MANTISKKATVLCEFFICFTCSFFIAHLSFSQQARLSLPQVPDSVSKGNSLLNIALLERGKASSHSFLNKYYGIDPSNLSALVSGILKKKASASIKDISMLCSSFSEVTPTIFTFQVELGKLDKLAVSPDIEYISLANKAEMQLQNSRRDAGIDRVHSGVGLPSPYTGKGVITGLIDVGIDYTHPAFKTEDGDSLRILKAWAQRRTQGDRPLLYNYGVEFNGPEEILAAQHDSVFGTHGNAVMGIMSGSGYGSAGKYAGAAPGSGIIAVSAKEGQDNYLLDGMRYVLDEVKSQQKRGVFNLSWGSLYGPHDGTSLFDQAVDSIVSNGLIVVGAAGNWGNDTVHLEHLSGSAPVVSTTLVKNIGDYSLVDMWGTANSTFSVQVSTIDKATGLVTNSSEFYSTRRQGEFEFNFVFGQDTTLVIVANIFKDKLNGRPRSTVAFAHNHQKTGNYVAVNIRSTNNEVHAWAAYNASFSNKISSSFVLDKLQSGDSRYSTPELGASSNSILTSGSHVSQTKFKNILGNDRNFSADSGNLGAFSGQGPTLDGRTKPDITSPGSQLAPANGFENSFTPTGGENYLIEEGSGFNLGARSWYWIQEEATSFSAPILTGTIALMLEANPDLTFGQIKSILQRTAITDNFTGEIPTTGSNLWGWGKLNAYRAVSDALGTVVTSIDNTETRKKFWYSNPNAGEFTVFCTDKTSGMPSLSLSDLIGRPVLQTNATSSQGYFYLYNIESLPIGQYIGTILLGESKRMVKISKTE